MKYKWSSCSQYSGDLVQLDSTPVAACVKSSTSVAADGGDVSDMTKENLEALSAAIAEKISNRRGIAPAGSAELSDEYLSVTDRLIFIPGFGYLLVNTELTGVETKSGDKVNAYVATRSRGLKGKASSFYLFDNGQNYASGKIGNFKLEIWASESADERKVFHFCLTRYYSRW